MNWAAILWLVLLVGFLIVEGATVTLICVWFAGGSLAALVVALLHGPVWLQLGVFLALSTVLLAALRPATRKLLKPKITATNVDSLIGSQGYVTEKVDNLAATGQVKLGAMPWTARSADGIPIEAGTLVRVAHIEGVKVFVVAVKETVSV